MAQQSQASSRAQGGVNAGGYANDTVCTIKSNLQKVIKKISWSYGASGGGIPSTVSWYGRLVVLDGVDGTNILSGLAGNIPTGIAATTPFTNADLGPNGITTFGGIVRFDSDILANNTCPLGGQFDFPDDDDAGGSLICTGGPLTVILFAPKIGAGTVVQAVTGKLYVQYRELNPNEAGGNIPTYSYKPISQPMT
jgi:hypothetical protein